MKRFFKSFGKYAGRSLSDFVIGTLTLALLAWIVIQSPDILKSVMDFNLLAIEKVFGLLNGEWAARSEMTFRLVLSGDRMMLVIEGILLIRTALFIGRWMTLMAYRGCCHGCKRCYQKIKGTKHENL